MIFMCRVLRLVKQRDAHIRTALNVMLYFASSIIRNGNGLSELGSCSSTGVARHSSSEVARQMLQFRSRQALQFRSM
jgi:hypothetical protein